MKFKIKSYKKTEKINGKEQKKETTEPIRPCNATQPNQAGPAKQSNAAEKKKEEKSWPRPPRPKPRDAISHANKGQVRYQ